jgi:hypothetical protein
MDKPELWGVRAEVNIQSELSISDLACEFRKRLEITDFEVETEMDPPHDEFAWGGVSGFTYWLHFNSKSGLFDLRMESVTLSLEMYNPQFYDISSWFKTYVELACEDLNIKVMCSIN